MHALMVLLFVLVGFCVMVAWCWWMARPTQEVMPVRVPSVWVLDED